MGQDERVTAVVFLIGLAALVAGADLLVRGATRLALAVGISPLVVGLTVVAFGTSAPEMAIAIGATQSGQTDIALGNVVGSNIFNVLFVLGLTALVSPLFVSRQIIRQEVPIMVGASVLLLLFAADGTIGFSDGAIMVAALMAYTVFLVLQSRRAEAGGEDAPVHDGRRRPWWTQLLLIVAGLALLVIGADLLVDAAVDFARSLGVSEVVIGLTIVAIGTSTPEIATSLTAVRRGHSDLAVGNVIGTNTFNLLGCIGVPAMIASGGLDVPSSLLNFDIWVMLAVAFACLPVFFTGRMISRWEGALFLGYYAAYAAYVVLAAQDHDALDSFSTVMMSFVVPITVVTLVVMMVRPGRWRSTGP